MRKVIDRHMYDTDTAKEQAAWEPSPYRTDFGWFCETLYRTKSGMYFIHGEGGPMTKYAESCGQNEWCSGERILPVSEEAAMKWTEEHCDGDTYERIFGELSDETVQVMVKLSAADAELLRRLKETTGKSYVGMITEWIRSAASDTL